MLNENKLEFINEKLFYDEVNGLSVYILPKKGYNKKFASITVKYGSNDIKFQAGSEKIEEYPLGIAHFLEHKLFEQKEGNLFDKFALMGASPNAFTNFIMTSYYFTSTNNFYKNLELLIKFVFNPYFTEENVQKEKGIIEQEIKMYEDTPSAKVYYNALIGMYKNHPVKNDIAGTIESINKITPELLYKCYNTFYVPQNMLLTVVGDVDEKEVINIIKNDVPLDRGKINFIRGEYEREKHIVEKFKHLNMNLSIPSFILAFKIDVQRKLNLSELLEKRIVMEVIAYLLFSKSSSIFEDLYSKGLINNSLNYEYTLEEGYSHFILAGESKEVNRAKDIIFQHINACIVNGIDSNEFERVKRVLIGSFITKFNNIENIGNSINDYFTRGMNLFDYCNIVNNLSLNQLYEIIENIFKEDNCVLSVVD